MIKRNIFLILLAVGVLAGGFFGLTQSLKNRMVNFPIKALTEEKLSALLGAKVKIGYVKFGIIRQVSLGGLEILPRRKSIQNFYLASAKGIVFQYNFFNLLTRNYSAPPKMILESPTVLLKSFQFPGQLFAARKAEKEAAGFLTRRIQLAVRKGEISYPLMEDKYKIGLGSINGLISPSRGESFQIRLEARGTGVLRGSIGVSGQFETRKKTYELDLRFRKDGEILLPGFLKIRQIRGVFHVRPDKIFFKQVRFSVADLLFEASGEILNYESGRPEIRMSFRMMLGRLPLGMDLTMDFAGETLSGLLRYAKAAVPFRGELFIEDSSLRIAGVKLPGNYELSADLNLKENAFQVSAEKDPFRTNVNFSFDDWDVVASINLEHFIIQDTDVVAFLRLRLSPTEALRREKKWEFHGEAETDYLIFDTEPINDLKGTFTVDHFTVRDIQLDWGPTGRITGVYDPFSPPNTYFTADIRSADLASLKHIFFYARPRKFGGRAAGKITVRGDLSRPFISGNVEVTDGILSNVNYRSAYLKFSGYYPYLRLEDSKLVRGKGYLYLKGDLNLKASNIFQDLEVVSEDHVVVWRGVILSENLDENLVMIGENLKRRLTE